MRALYSRLSSDTLLHIVNKRNEITDQRQDLSPQKEYLQVACFSMPQDKTFRPHKHIEQIRTSDIAQESWIVIQGRVKATLYDLDDRVLEEVVLEPGDCSITFRGGHNYTALEENTIVYEYKTGPYQGQTADKVFILPPS